MIKWSWGSCRLAGNVDFFRCSNSHEFDHEYIAYEVSGEERTH